MCHLEKPSHIPSKISLMFPHKKVPSQVEDHYMSTHCGTKKVCMLLEGIYGEIYYRSTSYVNRVPIWWVQWKQQGQERLFGPNITSICLWEIRYSSSSSCYESQEGKRGQKKNPKPSERIAPLPLLEVHLFLSSSYKRGWTREQGGGGEWGAEKWPRLASTAELSRQEGL